MVVKEEFTAKTVSKNRRVKIAYFILFHRLPEQFKRLFSAIYDPENYYLIHLDKKTDIQICNQVVDFLKDFPNVSILQSEEVVWGGYSMVQVELNGIKKLLELNLDWDFFINLSGQDFPLKPPNAIRDYLTSNKNTNFIKILNQKDIRPETMNRVENYFLRDCVRTSEIENKREYMKDVVSYIGGQWMILTRTCCEFFVKNIEVKKFEIYYANTLIPDEAFFQTVMMNTSFDEKIVKDDKRAIIWIPDGDIKLRPKTFTKKDIGFLREGDNLFARKFDSNVDSEILDIIEASFLRLPG